MDCGECIAKYLLCLFNFVFFVAGTVLLSVGTWLAAHKISLLELTNLQALVRAESSSQDQQHMQQSVSTLDQSAYILIAIGAFIFFISFLGYCGSLQESRVLLTTYGVFLIIIFALQIAGIVLTVVYRSQADEHGRFLLKESLSRSYTMGSSRNTITLAWDLVMSSMECCGLNNYTDFTQARLFVAAARKEGIGRKVPDACCIQEESRSLLHPANKDCAVAPSTSNSYAFQGCYHTFLHTVSQHLHLVVGCLLGVGASQLVAIAFAFCICKASG